MKKKLLIAVLIVIICESIAVSGVLLYLLYFSNNHDSTGTLSENIDAYKERKLKSSAFPSVKADIEVMGNVVTIKQDISFKKASASLFAYVPSVNNAETRLKNVYPKKYVSSYSLKDTILEISCIGDQTSISIEYEIILKDNTDFIGFDGTTYYLTNFLITPVFYNGTKPVLSYTSSFGDPYIYEINNYYVLFKTDKSLYIHAPGDKEEHVFGSNKITTFEADNIRDFPAIIYKNAEVEKAEYKGIDIYFINSKATKEYTFHVLEYAQENIGPYPYKKLYVVKAPMSQKGMEFSNMIFISDKCFTDKEELKRVTYHEILHQWFYGIIGTDQLNEPFLDEGIVNYLSIMLSDPKHFRDKPYMNSSGFENIPLKGYSSRDEYYKMAYNDSSVFFYNIHKKLGNNFYKMLREIYKDKKYKMLYFNEFMKYVIDYGGKQ